MSHLPPALFLMGPTASGKTELAVQLVQRLPVEIISVDSALIYKGMDIGTAKPDADTLAIAPHRLIDILDPVESYSAAQFCADAHREMQDVVNQGRIPLLVGGTMLYFRALRHGLSELPSADPDIRTRLEQEAAEQGWAFMHQRLHEVDPVTAQRLHQNDPQRIQRALEVYEITGVPMSQLYENTAKPSLPYEVIDLAIAPSDRPWLHERIAQRFHLMLQQGLIAEVEGLFQRGDLSLKNPSMRAVGYRQVWEYLQGKYNKSEMIERAIISTRQLAKRQYTWLRSEVPGEWYDSLDGKILDKVLKTLSNTPSIKSRV